MLLLALAAPPLAAQDASPAPAKTAEQALDGATQAYGPPAQRPRRARCAPESEEEGAIVVCGPLEDQEQFRVRSDEESEDDFAERTMNRGSPRAPNVDGPGIFQGPATFKLAPPVPVLIIDLEDIPEAPEGSDAALIGSGEKGD